MTIANAEANAATTNIAITTDKEARSLSSSMNRFRRRRISGQNYSRTVPEEAQPEMSGKRNLLIVIFVFPRLSYNVMMHSELQRRMYGKPANEARLEALISITPF